MDKLKSLVGRVGGWLKKAPVVNAIDLDCPFGVSRLGCR